MRNLEFFDSVVGNHRIVCSACGMRSDEQPLFRSNPDKSPPSFKCEQHIDVDVDPEVFKISQIAKEL